MSINYNLEIEQGATFRQVFTWQDASTDPATPYDLSGWTARMQVRKTAASSLVVLELTTENGGITLGGAAGTVSLYIAATATDDLSPNFSGVYDLELVGPSDVVRLVQGALKVSAEVTR